MEASISQVRSWLGAGWEMYWGQPPKGVYLLKEDYMADPADVDERCGEGPVVVYVAAVFDTLNVVYGRVKPGVARCPVATFTRRFPMSRVRHAVKTLVEFAVSVDRLPLFQLNPEVIRFAGLCGEYPLVCEEPQVVIQRLAERAGRRPAVVREEGRGGGGWLINELVKVLTDLMERDPSYVEVVRRVVEDPERLRECYV
jgi:hypothetical protein